MRAVGRQTATSGINPAGSSRVMRLDPLSLPLSFHAHDTRADGGVRRIELHRERVVLHRAVKGMRMAINVRVSDFLGVALRGLDDAQMLVLVHRDPALNIPLVRELRPRGDRLRLADVERHLRAAAVGGRRPREPAARRRRHNAIRARRPKFLVRRRGGNLLNTGQCPSGRTRDHRAGLRLATRCSFAAVIPAQAGIQYAAAYRFNH